MSRILVFTPASNRKGIYDYTGAFKPEAARFAKLHGVDDSEVFRIDTTRPQSARNQVLAAIAAHPSHDAFAFFSHGGTRWLMGPGIFPLTGAKDLARALAASSEREACTVALYACSTGNGADPTGEDGSGPGGDGGFADTLRDYLCRSGDTLSHVVAHDRLGHTSKNPYVIFADGNGSPVGGHGNRWIVQPGAKPLWARWRAAMNSTDLRFRMPFMTIAEIHAELMA